MWTAYEQAGCHLVEKIVFLWDFEIEESSPFVLGFDLVILEDDSIVEGLRELLLGLLEEVFKLGRLIFFLLHNSTEFPLYSLHVFFEVILLQDLVASYDGQ